MIGTVQRRKAKDVLRLFQRVDSVDRIELALEFAKRVEETAAPLPVLIEVNVSGESSKHGVEPDQVAATLDAIRSLKGIEVQGLMTMAPFTDAQEAVRPVFARLKCLADGFGLGVVSMGMSNDFDIAIEEGATEVRVGSALFE
jgi:hypothetical protein